MTLPDLVGLSLDVLVTGTAAVSESGAAAVVAGMSIAFLLRISKCGLGNAVTRTVLTDTLLTESYALPTASIHLAHPDTAWVF